MKSLTGLMFCIDYAVVLAGKRTLILAAYATESANQISEATVATAIELTRRSRRDTNVPANRCVAAQQTSELGAKAARVLQKIRTRGISERELQRKTSLRADELRLVVEHLVRLGQVRYRPEDDLVEPVRVPQPAGN